MKSGNLGESRNNVGRRDTTRREEGGRWGNNARRKGWNLRRNRKRVKVDEKFVASSLARRGARERKRGEIRFHFPRWIPMPPVEKRRNKTCELSVCTAVRLRLSMQMCTPPLTFFLSHSLSPSLDSHSASLYSQTHERGWGYTCTAADSQATRLLFSPIVVSGFCGESRQRGNLSSYVWLVDRRSSNSEPIKLEMHQ